MKIVEREKRAFWAYFQGEWTADKKKTGTDKPKTFFFIAKSLILFMSLKITISISPKVENQNVN